MNLCIISAAVLKHSISVTRIYKGQFNLPIVNSSLHYLTLCSSISSRNHCSEPNYKSDLSTKNDQRSCQAQDISPSLQTFVENSCDKMISSDVIPGKGRPPEPPVDCCMSGCVNCVWIKYAEELKQYYSDGSDRALKEIDKIENQSLKAFIKLELGLL